MIRRLLEIFLAFTWAYLFILIVVSLQLYCVLFFLFSFFVVVVVDSNESLFEFFINMQWSLLVLLFSFFIFHIRTFHRLAGWLVGHGHKNAAATEEEVKKEIFKFKNNVLMINMLPLPHPPPFFLQCHTKTFSTLTLGNEQQKKKKRHKTKRNINTKIGS